jgi:hypothetical protein
MARHRPHPALQRAPDAGAEFGMTAQQLVEDGDGAHTGRGAQHRHDLGIEQVAERIRAAPSSAMAGGGPAPGDRRSMC